MYWHPVKHISRSFVEAHKAQNIVLNINFLEEFCYNIQTEKKEEEKIVFIFAKRDENIYPKY